MYGVLTGNRWYGQINQFKERDYLHSREGSWEAHSHRVFPGASNKGFLGLTWEGGEEVNLEAERLCGEDWLTWP